MMGPVTGVLIGKELALLGLEAYIVWATMQGKSDEEIIDQMRQVMAERKRRPADKLPEVE